MTIISTDRTRPSVTARRVGFAISAAINAVLLYLIDGHPGWAVVPFLTDDAATVIAWVNVCLIAGLSVSLVQLACDPPWVVALAGMVTNGIGAAVLARIWQVFPFAFDGDSFNWPLLIRVVLVLGVLGSFAAFVTDAVKLVASRPAPSRH